MALGRGPFAVAQAAALLLACNALSGLDEDYRLREARSEGEDSGSEPDADGGSRPWEAGAPSDARTDPLDSGGPFRCPEPTPPGVVFCDDFEDASRTAPAFGWTEGALSTGGALTIEGGAGRGGSRALRATVVASGKSASSNLWVKVPVSWRTDQKLTMSFSFRLEAASTYAVLGAVEFGGREHGLAVYTSAGDCGGAPSCVDENDQQDRGHDPTGARPRDPSSWYRAVVTLTPSGGGFAGTVAVDGEALYSASVGAMPAGPVPKEVRIGAGAFYSGQSGSATVYVDDVLVELE